MENKVNLGKCKHQEIHTKTKATHLVPCTDIIFNSLLSKCLTNGKVILQINHLKLNYFAPTPEKNKNHRSGLASLANFFSEDVKHMRVFICFSLGECICLAVSGLNSNC